MLYRALYWFMAWIGRPFGGVRPRRIMYWLRQRGFSKMAPTAVDFRWYRDRAGNRWLLHPHYFIDAQIISFGEYEPELWQCIERHVRPGMICLDVGANLGLVSLPLGRRVGPSGTVHSFEPVPHIMQRLKQHVDRNGLSEVIRTHQLALSDRTGTVEMAVASTQEVNQGMASLVRQADLLTERITVSTQTLDDFADQHQLQRLDFIKLDVQGAETYILTGGQRTLRQFKPLLVVEVAPEDLVFAGQNSRTLLAHIESLGYEVFELQSDGSTGRRLRAEATPEQFYSAGVLCRMPTATA